MKKTDHTHSHTHLIIHKQHTPCPWKPVWYVCLAETVGSADGKSSMLELNQQPSHPPTQTQTQAHTHTHTPLPD